MSSNPASDGMFFVDHKAAPAPWPVAPVPPAAPAPVLASGPFETGGAMRDVPLGTLIFRAGLLAEEQLQDALQEGMRTGKRLGEVLAARGLITDTDLARLLAGQQGLAYVDALTLSVDPAAVARLPESIARIQNALAFALEDGVPVVAVGDPTDELLVESVRRALGVEPRLVVAAPGDLAKKIQEVYAARPTPLPQPVAEPAGPAPLVTPMPMTAPPPEERASEPEAAIPPVAPPAPTGAVSFLHAPAPVEHPLAPEPVAPQPVVAPAPEPTPVEPVSAPPVAPPVEKPPAEPVVVIAEGSPAPAEPDLFVQAAAEAALAPAVVEPPPVAQPQPLPASTAAEPTHLVALRLTGDDRVEIGGFAGQDEAESFARTVVGRITRSEEQAEWPLFGDRFIRPQTIVSVDVVDRSPGT